MSTRTSLSPIERSAAAIRLAVTPPPLQGSSPITSRMKIVAADGSRAMMPASHLLTASASGSKAQIVGRRSAMISGSLRRLIAILLLSWCGRKLARLCLAQLLQRAHLVHIHPGLMTARSERLGKELGLIAHGAAEQRALVELGVKLVFFSTAQNRAMNGLLPGREPRSQPVAHEELAQYVNARAP